MSDAQNYRDDFPILAQTIHGKRLVYLDNAATTQKPRHVIEAIQNYYATSNANVHRGVHVLGDKSTVALEKARNTIATFFGAKNEELILTRNTTEAINGVLYGWALHNLQEGDVILTSNLEHHSNFVVWQQACTLTGATLKVVPLTQEGQLDYEWLEANLDNARLLALSYVSNALGVQFDIPRIVAAAKKSRARVLIDGAQAAAHLPIRFDSLGIDFLAVSGHKLYGPMGSGGLLVRSELLRTNEMQPWLFGGGMIAEVHEDTTIFNDDPTERFTAGTPDVASAVGLAAACDYISSIGLQKIAAHESQLVSALLEKLQALPQITVVGPQQNRVGSVAFLYEGVHAHDVAQVLDSEGVAVRSGHHCTMPLHTKRNWIATTRASVGVYNTIEDIDACIHALLKVATVFGK